LFNAKLSNFSAISWREQVNFQRDDTNKTDRLDITEILLKVALTNIK